MLTFFGCCFANVCHKLPHTLWFLPIFMKRFVLKYTFKNVKSNVNHHNSLNYSTDSQTIRAYVCCVCVFLCALDFQIKLFPSIHFSLNTVFCLIEWQHEKCKYITVCLTFCYMPISLQYFTLSRFIRHYFMFLQIAQTRYANVHQLYVAKIKQQHNNSRVIRQSQHNESIYTWTSV